MLKYLLLILLALAVWWGWKKRRDAAVDAGKPPARSPEAMVACAHCGVYLPASDAVTDNGRHYCTPAHRDAACRRN